MLQISNYIYPKHDQKIKFHQADKVKTRMIEGDSSASNGAQAYMNLNLMKIEANGTLSIVKQIPIKA